MVSPVFSSRDQREYQGSKLIPIYLSPLKAASLLSGLLDSPKWHRGGLNLRHLTNSQAEDSEEN